MTLNVYINKTVIGKYFYSAHKEKILEKDEDAFDDVRGLLKGLESRFKDRKAKVIFGKDISTEEMVRIKIYAENRIPKLEF